MTNTINRDWVRGSTEYLDYEVTADVELAAQEVAITFDRATFHTAEWIGAPGTTRVARILLDDSELPQDSVFNVHHVFVRITDDPEVPLIPAGTLTII